MRAILIIVLTFIIASELLVAQKAELSIQKGHVTPVTKIAFDPAGKLLASGDKSGKVIIWHLATSRQMAEFKLPGKISALCFSPESAFLLVGYSDSIFAAYRIEDSKTVFIQPINSSIKTIVSGNSGLSYIGGDQLFGINYIKDSINLIQDSPCVEILKDGSTGVLILFNAQGYRWMNNPTTLIPSDQIIYSVHKNKWDSKRNRYQKRINKFTGDNSFSRYRKERAEFLLWNLKFKMAYDTVTNYAVNIANNRLAAARGNRLELYDYNKGYNLSSRYCDYFDEKFNSVVISDKYNLVIATNTDRSIYVYSAEQGEFLSRIMEHLGPVNDIRLSPDQKYFATSGDDCSIILWSTENLQPLKRFYSRTFPITALFADLPATTLYYGNEIGMTGCVKMDSSDFKIRAVKTQSGPVTGISVSADSLCYTVGTDNTLAQVNLYLGTPVDRMKHYKPFPNSDKTEIIIFGKKLILTGTKQKTAFLKIRGRERRNPLVIYDQKGASLDNKKVLSFKLDQETWLEARRNKYFSTLVESGNSVQENSFYSVLSDVLIDWKISDKGIYYQTIQLDKPCTGKASLLNSDTIVFQSDSSLSFFSISAKKEVLSFQIETKAYAVMMPIIVFSSGSNLFSYNIETKNRDTIPGIQNNIRIIKFIKVDIISVAGEDGFIQLFDIKNKKKLCTIIPIDKDKEIAITDDNYFLASKNALDALGYKYGSSFFSPEQFDLQFNRPDIVLERIGLAPAGVITAFRKAYYKRLQKMNYNESMFSSDLHMPEVSIINMSELSPVSAISLINLTVKAKDARYKLNSLHLTVNGIPVFGINGINLRYKNIDSTQMEIPLHLSQGNNKVQVSCLNEKGVESLKETFEIRYEPAKPVNADVYFVGIGVSDYTDTRLNLNYAAKDIRDLSAVFKEKYPGLIVDTLLNKIVTRENVLSLKKQLLKSKVDDLVILSISGHGFLSDSLDFYYGTSDIDCRHPEIRGLSYDDIEWLLDSIPARKKLVMMDACHSGEVDKDILEGSGSVQLAENVTAKAAKGAEMIVDSTSMGLQNSFELMQELFTNLSKGNGAVVISAAGGLEYAYEGAGWGNGVFTYCIRKGLEDMEADVNGDKTVSVNELKVYLYSQVGKLTNGKQTPTSRSESLENDWPVW